MDEEIIHETKKEIYKELDELKRRYFSFKTRVSVILNLIVPGIGFFVYGRSYIKGLIVLILFLSYNLLFFLYISNITDLQGLYYIPAIIIWIVSTIMVASLEDT